MPLPGDFTPTTPGTYQWVVRYSGDALHAPSTGTCGDATEQVAVVVTELTKTPDKAVVAAGSPIGFTVTLHNPGPLPATGLALTDPLPAQTGLDWSIANQQGPATCSVAGSPPTQTLDCGTFTLAADESQTVHLTSPTAAGVCAVVANTATAALAGDPVTATSSITVTCPTSIDTTPSHASGQVGLAVHDTADVSGGQPAPGGTVDFALYPPGDQDCTHNLLATNASFHNVALTNGQATSPAYTTTQTGIYQWVATYSGDKLHHASAGACSDPSEQVTIEESHTPQGTTTPDAEPPPTPPLATTGTDLLHLAILAIALTTAGALLLATTTLMTPRRRPPRHPS